MVFSTFTFLFRFLPIAFLCYFAVPRKLKNLVLFLFSLIFYAWGEPIYVGIMIFSTVFDYINGLLVSHFQQKDKNKAALAVVIVSALVNLGLLGVFKYMNLVCDTLNQVFSLDIQYTELALPIGISFYTFQTMSYTIDVYRKDAKAQKNIINFGTYVAMFPQLIAGPIVRYKTVAEQLQNRTISFDSFSYGCFRFCIGLGKKVLLANTVGYLFSQIAGYREAELPMLMAWLGILCFALQIYFDFSGYSDMAIGLGAIFGFHFQENFNYPYISKSITEFWRRWHISLGTWFKEYVYVPLGGNRKGNKRQILNIFIVWGLTGIWHGASWNFLYWGLYFAVLLVVEKLFLQKWLEKIPAFLQHIYALIFIFGGWTIFAFPDLMLGKTYYKAMLGLGAGGIINEHTLALLWQNASILILAFIACTKLPQKLIAKVCGKHENILEIGKFVWMVVVFLLCIAYLVNDSYNPFLYFRF